MRLTIAAIGRLGRGPESAAISEYLRRVEALAPRAAIGPARVVELERRGRGAVASDEGALLLEAAKGATRIALDGRGRALSSADFARLLGDLRDRGAPAAAFLIGGADGHTRATLEACDMSLSFGAMTWPHALARLMLVEQIYRAQTILTGHPYHREGSPDR